VEGQKPTVVELRKPETALTTVVEQRGFQFRIFTCPFKETHPACCQRSLPDDEKAVDFVS
jgi:hypothetical protein